jgi:muramoyltetrapeptide carboxypeptidase
VAGREAKLQEINIGVIFPSCDLKKKTLDKSVKIFAKYGFNLITISEVNVAASPFRNDAKTRTREIEELFKREDVNIILCARGGYGSHHILEHLDYGIIKQNPKIFIGYSDATSLLLAINSHSSIMTYHGPMLSEMIKNDAGFFAKLRKHITSSFRKLEAANISRTKILKTGSVSGKILAGNLATICASLGTKDDVDFTDKIVFLEDVDEEIYRIDRYLTSLKQAGKFESAKAVIFGNFINISNEQYKYKITLRNLIEDRLEDFKGPILWGYPFGHKNTDNFIPIGAGCLVNLTDDEKQIKFYF